MLIVRIRFSHWRRNICQRSFCRIFDWVCHLDLPLLLSMRIFPKNHRSHLNVPFVIRHAEVRYNRPSSFWRVCTSNAQVDADKSYYAGFRARSRLHRGGCKAPVQGREGSQDNNVLYKNSIHRVRLQLR